MIGLCRLTTTDTFCFFTSTIEQNLHEPDIIGIPHRICLYLAISIAQFELQSITDSCNSLESCKICVNKTL